MQGFEGDPSPEARSSGRRIAEILCACLVLAEVSALAAGAMQERVLRSRETEAGDYLARIYRSAVSYAFVGSEYYQCHYTCSATQFPRSGGPTPGHFTRCSRSPGGLCQPEPEAWDTATWQALNFVVVEPHRFVYEFESRGLTGCTMSHCDITVDLPLTFTARAVGDVDGDGLPTTFERGGRAVLDGVRLSSVEPSPSRWRRDRSALRRLAGPAIAPWRGTSSAAAGR